MTDFVLPSGDLLVSPAAIEQVNNLLIQMSSASFAEQFIQKVNMFAEDDDDGFWDTGSSWARPYRVKDRVLTIPVKGMLMSGLPYAFGSYGTGYEYITAAVLRGIADPEVDKIILDIDSPGGTVSGAFDCADVVYNARGDTPIHAVANESAYSAAYAIASSADSLTVARTGGVGSIGVMTTHRDLTAALQQRGVKITPVFAGKQKAEGHPFVPLTAEAEARIQARIDAIHDIFVSTVARNRNMSEQAVRDTEAGAFMVQEAIEIGLADAVGNLDTLSANADPFNENEDEEMSKENSVDQAEHDTAVAKATAAGTATGMSQGATEERTRVSTILGSDIAKTHPEAANHLALKTDMSAEAAASFLADLPAPAKVETPAPKGNGFENAMNNGGNPELGADDNGGNDPEVSVSDGIFASAGFAPTKA